MDWKRIAEILTEKWHADGTLPIWKDDVEYNYVYAAHPNRRPKILDHDLRYAHTEIFLEGSESFSPSKVFIRCHGSIDKKFALKEAWPHLTEEEKTAIMVETLGKKNDKSE